MGAAERGVDVVAIDLLSSNVEWGLQHLRHLSAFCQSDGSILPFEANTFDAILSNAALLHVNGERAQCAALREVLRVLRPRGCAWFGVNGAFDRMSGVPPEFWTGKDGCFEAEPDVIVKTFHETDLFGTYEYHQLPCSLGSNRYFDPYS